jgi:hypothetical protein
MVEFHVVALLAMLPMCLGALQMALLMVENHHLDHAAFLAVRHGAVRQGDMGEVRRAYAEAATTLFIGSASPLDSGNVVPRVALAHAAARADVAAFARARILSPTAAASADFAVRRSGWQVIPNDALEYRSSTPGARSGLSIQQANILRVEFVYCRPLIVPFASTLLQHTLRRLDADPWHQACYAAGRIPVRSEGVAPMQSDFRVTS